MSRLSVFSRHGFGLSRCFGSKTWYITVYPNNKVIFNASIATVAGGRVWYGDIDVDRDTPKLKAVADELCEDLYILTEHAVFEADRLEDANAVVIKFGI